MRHTAAKAVVLTTDDSLRVTSWTADAARLYRTPAGDVIGRRVTEAVHSGWTERQLLSAATEARLNGSFAQEDVHHDGHGRPLPVTVRLSGLQGETEAVSGFLLAVHPLVAPVTPVDAGDMPGLARAMAEHSSEIIALVSGTGEVRYASPSLRRILECDAAEFVGKHLLDRIHPDDIAEASGLLMRVLQSSRFASATVRIRRKDNAWRVMRFTASNHLADPEIGAIVVNCADEDELKEAQEALSQQELLMQKVMEHVPAMMTINNAGGRLLFASKEYERVLGYSENEVRSERSMAQRVFPDLEDSERALEFVRAAEGQWQEFQPLTRDGRKIRVLWAVMAVGRLRLSVARLLGEPEARPARGAQGARAWQDSDGPAALPNPYDLTFRELTILSLVASGKPDKEIAYLLGISPRTVQAHISSILVKMSASARTDASVRALRERLIS